MLPLLDRFLNWVRDLRNYVLMVILFLILSYSVFLIFSDYTIIKLGEEDGVFESLTALFFLLASIFFIKIYFSNKNVWFLILALVFFIGCGEEISWGQRYFNISTPDTLVKINVQKEMNFHNIGFFNAKGKTGIAKLHSIEFLYKLFWLTYGVLLPIGAFHIRSVFSITKKMRLPIPPVPIGIFFLINWLIFRISLSYIVPPDKDIHYVYSIVEIMECCTSFIFLTLSIYFFNNKNLNSFYSQFSEKDFTEYSN